MDTTQTGTRQKALSSAELSVFCTQVALVLQAGIPLSDGLAGILEESRDDKSRSLLGSMVEQVEQNGTFYEAVRQSGLFPPYLVQMVGIGEKTGRLEDVMNSLADYYTREQAVRERVKSALLYPFILVCMMSVVIFVLVIKVLPIFQQVLDDLGGGLSITGTGVMGAGVVISRVALVVIGVALVALVALGIYMRVTGGGGRLFLHFGPTRRIVEKISSARVAFGRAMMLKSGYNLDEALELVPTVVDSPEVAARVNECRRLVGEGDSLSTAAGKAGLFSGMYLRMVGTGDRTGTLDSVMDKLSDLYEDEVQASLDNFVSIIEPTMVAVLSVIVGVILLSVMLPLMGILSSIG